MTDGPTNEPTNRPTDRGKHFLLIIDLLIAKLSVRRISSWHPFNCILVDLQVFESRTGGRGGRITSTFGGFGVARRVRRRPQRLWPGPRLPRKEDHDQLPDRLQRFVFHSRMHRRQHRLRLAAIGERLLNGRGMTESPIVMLIGERRAASGEQRSASSGRRAASSERRSETMIFDSVR